MLGLVSMIAATSGPSAALTAATSTVPSARAGIGLHGVAEEGGGRGVGAVGAVGDEHDGAVPLPARFLRGLDGHHAEQLAVGAGLGRERDGRWCR